MGGGSAFGGGTNVGSASGYDATGMGAGGGGGFGGGMGTAGASGGYSGDTGRGFGGSGSAGESYGRDAGMGGGSYEALEQDADITAAGVMSSLWKTGGSMKHLKQTILPRLTSGLRLQRCGSGSSSSGSSSSSGGTTRATSIRAVPQTPTAALASAAGLSGTAATAGPNKLPFGLYSEFIGWQTDGRNGVIVQEISNTYSVAACPPYALGAGPTPTAHYYEAWHVDGSGNVTPIVGAVNDMWVRPNRPHTSGSWSMNANVFWAPSLDPAASFSANNVPDAASLESTTTAPTNLGTAITTRSASGNWDCTGAHT